MTQILEDDFYTIPEAARSLRVSVSTIWRWIDSGRLMAYRVGQRRIRIKKEDLGAIVKPFLEGKEAGKGKAEEGMEIFKMSPTEGKDQRAVMRKARSLQEQIAARRGGELLPSSWQDLTETREERSAEL